MFNIDINDPFHQMMMQNFDDEAELEERCPDCGSKLIIDQKNSMVVCTNKNCDYHARVRTRKY